MSLMVSYNLAIKKHNPKFYESTDIVRLNSPWYTEEELIGVLEKLDKPCFLDINIKKRTKTQKAIHNYKTLLEIANDYKVEWIGISNVEDQNIYMGIKEVINNSLTRICAKVETEQGCKNILNIIKAFDGIMVDVEDLASEIGWTKASLFKDQIYRLCMRHNKSHFRLGGVIFEYVEHKTIVYTYGAWDLLHPGHIKMLKKAKSFGDMLWVGVVDDEAIKQLKGDDRPILSLDDRINIIESVECVDKVVVQETYDPVKNLEMIKPDVLVKGDDWKHIPGEEWIKEHGGKLIKPPYTNGPSTSKIIKKIRGN